MYASIDDMLTTELHTHTHTRTHTHTQSWIQAKQIYK